MFIALHPYDVLDHTNLVHEGMIYGPRTLQRLAACGYDLFTTVSGQLLILMDDGLHPCHERIIAGQHEYLRVTRD